jgi:hypothetical protein
VLVGVLPVVGVLVGLIGREHVEAARREHRRDRLAPDAEAERAPAGLEHAGLPGPLQHEGVLPRLAMELHPTVAHEREPLAEGALPEVGRVDRHRGEGGERHRAVAGVVLPHVDALEQRGLAPAAGLLEPVEADVDVVEPLHQGLEAGVEVGPERRRQALHHRHRLSSPVRLAAR